MHNALERSTTPEKNALILTSIKQISKEVTNWQWSLETGRRKNITLIDVNVKSYNKIVT